MLRISLLLFLLTSLVYIVFTWLMQFDFEVPEVDLELYVRRKTGKKGKLHFMTIYPHPDDETMMSGGTIAKYAQNPDIRWTVVSLTRGEHGDGRMKGIDPRKLAKIRKAELHRACEVLGASQLIFGPFEDGTLKKRALDLEKFISQLYKDEKPDLVLTFERGGVYGHPDHVSASSVIRKLQTKYKKIPVLYGGLPTKILSRIKLPTHMAEDPENLQHDVPQMRVTFWKQGWKKYLAAVCHCSQDLTSKGTRPLWLKAIVFPIEYYSVD